MTRLVSEASVEILSELLAWELFENDVDPKILLRQVSLADLSVIAANIQDDPETYLPFACTALINLELKYRKGEVRDWNLVRDGQHVHITSEHLFKTPIQYINLNFVVEHP